jgi:FKBP-type peptidyl-prolyl cis-trans isomerase
VLVLKTFSALALFFFTAIACTRQVPQLPANKSTVDSSSLALQLANERLISGEDSLVQNFISKANIDFQKSNSGLWYKIYNIKTNQNKPEQGQSCKIDYKVFSLENKLLFSESKTFIIGKKQLVNGVEETFLYLSEGDSATAVVPWYIGYGMKGNQHISPYTSVVVYVKRLK